MAAVNADIDPQCADKLSGDCLHRMIFFGEGPLRHALAKTEIFYNQERPHQALENKIIRGEFAPATAGGEIVRRRRLGGMLNFYFREAS